MPLPSAGAVPVLLPGSYQQAWRINAAGEIIGGDIAGHPVYWADKDTSPLVLDDIGLPDGPAGVRGINASGGMTGYAGTGVGGAHVVTWDTSGAITDLGVNGRSYAIGRDNNDAGEIGVENAGVPVFYDGSFHDLALGASAAGTPYGLNNSGRVVGNKSSLKPVWWDTGTYAVTLLGTVAGSPYGSGQSINDSDVSCGFLEQSDSPFADQATRWDASGTATILNQLSGETDPNRLAWDINSAGVVVGSVDAYGSPTPVYWDGDDATPLGLLAGGTDAEAFGINDFGYIVGICDNQAVIWVPSGAWGYWDG